MSKKYKYHAFISYSHTDRLYASVIQKSIETLGLPFYKRWQPNVSLFRDQRKIPLSESLTSEIINGLKESKYLLVIASKNSATSKWVKEEIMNWHSINHDKDSYITNFNFILIDDIVEWDYQNHDFDKLKTTALPIFENKMFKEPPIWANLQNYCRDGKIDTNNSNYEWEIAKVKGLLLNGKPDEIIDEESKGKRIFRVAISFVISILIALTAFAFIQRDIAKAQEEKALKQEEIAKAETSKAINNLKMFKLEEFERNYRNGNIFLEAEEFCFAKSCFIKADSTAKDSVFKNDIPIEKTKYLDSVIAYCTRIKPDCN